MGERRKVVVIGVGNELRGDDAVGVLVARRLAREKFDDSVEVIEGHTGGMNLLFDIEGAERCIIVDAVDMGRQPGAIEVFDAEDADIVLTERVASLHHVSLADVLQLARITGINSQITVVGIQPRDTAPGEGLSDDVAARLDELVETVRRLVAQALQQ